MLEDNFAYFTFVPQEQTIFRIVSFYMLSVYHHYKYILYIHTVYFITVRSVPTNFFIAFFVHILHSHTDTHAPTHTQHTFLFTYFNLILSSYTFLCNIVLKYLCKRVTYCSPYKLCEYTFCTFLHDHFARMHNLTYTITFTKVEVSYEM